MPSKRTKSRSKVGSGQDQGPLEIAGLSLDGLAQAFYEANRKFSEVMSPIVESLIESQRQMASLREQLTEGYRQAIEGMRALTESPFFPVFQKMASSKGIMKRFTSGRNVFFIPDAVLYYGFAHLPSDSDPEGKQFQGLPLPPRQVHRDFGTYVLRADSGTRRSTSVRDPHFKDAQTVYRESGNKGLDPLVVLQTLLMAHVVDHIWLEVDLEQDLMGQLTRFRKWVEEFRREVYRRPGQKAHRRPEAARDALIYTLKYSGEFSALEIAKRVFPEEFSPRSAYSLDERVRQSLRRTRKALNSAGYKQTESGKA